MLVKLMQVERGLRGGTSTLKVIFLNPSHIVSVSEDLASKKTILKETPDLGLSPEVQFSKVVIQEGTVSKSLIIVGPPWEIHQKLKKQQVLRG